MRPFRLAAGLRIAVCVLSVVRASSVEGAQGDIRIQGSVSMANALQESLTAEFNIRYDDIHLDWRSAGTGAVFVSLFSGEADVGLASRSVSADELKLASGLGLELREIVVGLDGLAVVVHPDNDVPSLTLEQLESLYSGRIVTWVGFGGIDESVTLLGPPRASGSNTVFRELVFENDATPFARSVDYTASSSELLDRVASERGAVGFISMGYDRSRVRTVSVSDASTDPSEPTRDTVGAGVYPLRHPLRLYTVSQPAGQLRLFLTFLFLHRGSELVSSSGLVPVQAFGTWSREMTGAARGPNVSDESDESWVSMTRVSFGFRGRRLSRDGTRRLRELAARLGPAAGVWIAGHESPDETVPGRDLSNERAQTVADYLEQRDVERSRMIVDGRRSGEPIASNDVLEGRRTNRRVDVWVLSHWPR